LQPVQSSGKKKLAFPDGERINGNQSRRAPGWLFLGSGSWLISKFHNHDAWCPVLPGHPFLSCMDSGPLLRGRRFPTSEYAKQHLRRRAATIRLQRNRCNSKHIGTSSLSRRSPSQASHTILAKFAVRPFTRSRLQATEDVQQDVYLSRRSRRISFPPLKWACARTNSTQSAPQENRLRRPLTSGGPRSRNGSNC
jgi:hypothetical protein